MNVDFLNSYSALTDSGVAAPMELRIPLALIFLLASLLIFNVRRFCKGANTVIVFESGLFVV